MAKAPKTVDPKSTQAPASTSVAGSAGPVTNLAASQSVAEQAADPEAAQPHLDTVPPKAPKRKSRRKSGSLGIFVGRLVDDHPWLLLVCWVFAIFLWLLIVPTAVFAWLYLLPALWGWVADSFGRGLAALFPSLILIFAPVYLGMGAYMFSEFVASLELGDEKENVERTRDRVRETEEDALNRLETTDEAHLLPLLRYSRAQLDAYYAIGLAQTRRSFFNSVIAMWLGFAILIVGIALYIGPVESFGFERPKEDFNVLILSSAAIVEFISALFLWVYRSTINQLTFYYRLQMRSHTAILCFRISSTMQQADEAKRAIITSVLDTSLMPEPTPPTGSKGFSALIRGGN